LSYAILFYSIILFLRGKDVLGGQEMKKKGGWGEWWFGDMIYRGRKTFGV